MKKVIVFGAVLLVIIFITSYLIWSFQSCRDDYRQGSEECQSWDDCRKTCGVISNPRTVLYTYHLYPEGKTPSIDQLDPQDVLARFTRIIDSGYEYIIFSFYQYPDATYRDTIGAFGIFMSMDSSIRSQIIDYAHSQSVKVFLSIGGAVGSSSIQQGTVQEIGDDIVSIVVANNFDGVDIDVEDANLFMKISDLTNYLADKFSSSKEISHAPQSANFRDNTGQPTDYFTVYKNCGDRIDFLNVQFYNQGCTHDTYAKLFEPDNNMCYNLAWISTGHKVGSTDYGSVIPLEKLLIGKPICTSPCPYGGANGYVDPKTLGQWFVQGESDMGWNAGLMIWEYDPEDTNAAKNYLNAVYGS